MKIKIAYSSKWSVELMNELRVQKICSMGDLENKNANSLNLDHNDNYESIMKKISQTYENFTYKTISKNTVLGILARLLGEVRYLNIALNDVEHPVNKLKDKVTFKVNDRTLYNEIVYLYKKPTQVKDNGGGLAINLDNLLLGINSWSTIIYSIFNLKDVQSINSFVDHIIKSTNLMQIQSYINNNNLLYSKEIAIHNFVMDFTKHKEVFSNLYKDYKLETNLLLDKKITSYNNEVKELHQLLTKIALYTSTNLDEESQFKVSSWNELNIVGLLCYFIVKWSFNNGFINEINNEKLINNNNKIQGIAETSGGLTVKDLYRSISPKKLSWNMPYTLKTKMMKKKDAPQINQLNTNIGIGKECGILEINIDIPIEQAKELKQQIKDVAVATFQLGKKGLAYVKEIDVYE